MKKTATGFTIVELLIVIVVIAILAAIAVVAYSGIQQRANNATIISAAKSSFNVISAYIAANGKYPGTLSNGTWCTTTTSGCVINTATVNGNALLDSDLASIGTLPRSIPMSGSDQTGIAYSYSSARTYNGKLQPGLLYYTLYGMGQSCGLPEITVGWTEGTPSTSGYSVANVSSTGKTLCYLHIPGPSS